jgi:hypothetical protein
MHETWANLCLMASGGCLFAAASGSGWLPVLGSILTCVVNLWVSEQAHRQRQEAESARNLALLEELAELRCQRPTPP